jgi:transcriptional regulator with XRE-family HTH domain
MASRLLPNYLVAERKRLALSQKEVAFMLGKKSGEQVSRHERFSLVPALETALEYEAIYKKPVSELFSGLFDKAKTNVADRAELLDERDRKTKGQRRNLKQKELLRRLAFEDILKRHAEKYPTV